MKTKTFNKKMSLKKQTVAHLYQKEMKHIKGGATIPLTNCPDRTCDIRCN